MARKKKQQPDESTYKSSVFGNPVIKVLIIIAVFAFIIMIALPDLSRIFGNSRNTLSYVKVNNKELFITQGYYSNEVRNLIGVLNYYKKQFGQQTQYLMSFMESMVDNMVMKEIYSQTSEKVGLAMPVNALYNHFYNKYTKLVYRAEMGEELEETVPNEFGPYEQRMKVDYKVSNIERPLNEGILLSKLDIVHQYNLEDTRSKIYYVFYGFEDFVNSIKDSEDIDADELKTFMEEQKKSVIIDLSATVMEFDDEESADKASTEDDPFEMDEYKENISGEVTINNGDELFDELSSLSQGSWKRAVMDYRGNKVLFKIKDKNRSTDYDELKSKGLLSEIVANYIRANSDDYLTKYKETATQKLNDFKARVESGEDFLKVAKDNNIEVFGETDFFAINADKIETLGGESNHTSVLRRAKQKNEFVITAFTTDIGNVSEVLSTVENEELDVIGKDDYYYLISPIELEFPDGEPEESRQGTIADDLRSEIESEFRSMKQKYFRRKNNVEINYANITSIDQIAEILQPSEDTGGDVLPDMTDPTTVGGGDTGGSGLGIGSDSGSMEGNPLEGIDIEDDNGESGNPLEGIGVEDDNGESE